jgi:hypothetical protein
MSTMEFPLVFRSVPLTEANGCTAATTTEITVEAIALTPAITFKVNVSPLVEDGGLHRAGIFLTGEFSEFQNIAMTEGADNIWST